ncbi:type II toxin-antitoxin system HicB family antitoxin [Lachnoclostridium phytofermentans]|uniref:type II toxin-antitoxin system HicB family antitoxin n=1 Tax=Lachnoclostridium phytofermentans TaxID=66219 RepID=UPI000495AC34|nr:type II toxin-antitoxin system HicB family antitoxin [Lachnoclostridium phytofermentans]
MKLIYPAILTPFSDDSGGFVVEFPDLQGCITEGKTLAEALEMGVDAASGWVLDELEDGNKIPAPSNITDIIPPAGSFVNLFVLDMDSYSEKYGSQSIRTNVTIPAWLKTFGEKQNLNFSKVLQDALLEKESIK